MPSASPGDLVARVRQTAAGAVADVCWAQWGTLGFMAGGTRGPAGAAFIDPEVLLLMTLDAVATEPRLDQALNWWADVGADLVSVPRLKAVRGGFPDLDARLAEFAARAVAASATSTAWKRMADGARAELPDRPKGVSDPGTGLDLVARPSLASPAAAMLRVRALAGVGAKADVLAFLAAQGGRSASVKTLEKALGYSYVPLRRATDDLVAAGLAQTETRPTGSPGRDPIRFAYRPGTLDLGDVPPWRFWPQIAAFLLQTARWGDGLPPEPSPYLLASRARDLARSTDAFVAEHPLPDAYPIPDPRRYPGEAYLDGFAETVESVARWVADGLPQPAPGLITGITITDVTPTRHGTPPPASMTDAVTDYLARIEATLRTGDATEHSHRPALQALLEAAGGAALGRPLSVVNEPKRTRVGAPDFVVRLAGVPLGYAEAKDVGVALDPETEQLRRYRDGLRNLLFTDGLTFRWFADGAERDAVTLAERVGDGPTVTLRERTGAGAALADLLGAFFRFEAPAITTARDLATRMAAATRLLRDAIARSFDAEAERGALHQQFQAFRDVLVQGLTPDGFADMYAQTLAYGLFAARAAGPDADGFSRLTAAAHLPPTNPFLRRLFYEVAGPDLDERIAWLVDDLATLLARADLARILRGFGQRTRQADAVVHFYETFLQAYDAALRDARGVYYTPEPVVGWLVRSVDAVLARDFGLADGLADASTVAVERPETADRPARTEAVHRVQVLDPATGTGTFLHAVLRAVHARFEGNEGLWDAYVADHLLPRVHGFELLMAPYTVAHLKLGLFLGETGYTFSRDERLNVFLTNALDGAAPAAERAIPFARWLADEAAAADRVKRDTPVMVVVGNPPYSGHSANTGDWITRLMRGHDTQTGRPTESYFEVDGGPLGERNPKWLNDDYVKFLRMAQEQVARTGSGVVAFVTNHGFLDNPTFRGMRQSLMTAFDRLYLLDLHGNAKKKETTPQGGHDENVFDIMQGVSLTVMVRLAEHSDEPAEVWHADLWGARADKYAALDAADVTTTAWTRLDPQTPRYLFGEVDRDLREEYDEGWSVTDIFPKHSVGIVTARDALTIHFTEDEEWEVVQRFAELSEKEAREEFKLRKDARDWKVALAQSDVRRTGPDRERLGEILYRPFDARSTYFTGTSRGFQCMPRWEITRHMIERENIGLVWTRPMSPTYEFSVLVSAAPIDQCAVGNKSAGAGISYLGPLWLTPEPDEGLFAAEAGERKANLAPDFVAALDEATGLAYAEGRGGAGKGAFTPEDVFHYVYGVLHAPAYRARYADFLKSDYPGVPLPPTREAFRAFAEVGRRLVALHLLRDVPDPGTRFPVQGSNTVDKGFPAYVPPGGAGPDGEAAERGRVYLNDTQFFEGVEPEVWAHQVGGYQVLDKWLKDRRGRALSYDDLRRYPRVVAALRETQRLMADADDAAAEAFGW